MVDNLDHGKVKNCFQQTQYPLLNNHLNSPNFAGAKAIAELL